jgi:hypothetical protein
LHIDAELDLHVRLGTFSGDAVYIAGDASDAIQIDAAARGQLHQTGGVQTDITAR